jgi:hypothetical protein
MGLFANYGQQGGMPQMSQDFKGGIDPGRNMMGQEVPGFQVNQMAAPSAVQQRPQQSFDQFAQTLQGSGLTSGAMQDAYQKSLQPQSTDFTRNVGPGGTQNPYPNSGPQPFPSNWGQQTFGFDPRSMAGKTVGKDMGWYYGQDAIGRQINNAGDAYPTFRGAADGFNRRTL